MCVQKFLHCTRGQCTTKPCLFASPKYDVIVCHMSECMLLVIQVLNPHKTIKPIALLPFVCNLVI